MAQTETRVQQDDTVEAVKDELLTLEKRYWQAIQNNDLEAALDLTDDPCIVTGAQGVASRELQDRRRVLRPRHAGSRAGP
jgi:hypothetical protein